jgi:hypothetical protein
MHPLDETYHSILGLDRVKINGGKRKAIFSPSPSFLIDLSLSGLPFTIPTRDLARSVPAIGASWLAPLQEWSSRSTSMLI